MTPTTRNETASPQGTVERSGDDYVLRFQRRFDHSIDRVWRALTEPDELRTWLAAAEIDLRKGGELVLRWLSPDAEGYALHATITEVDPPRLFEWDGETFGVCRWELREDGDGCVLEFSSTPRTEEIAAKAAADPERWSNASMLAGWHWHLDKLAGALEGRSVDWSASGEEEWAVLYDRYGGERR
jgi:uncharacterized protein YndB with AHSA1/START domain